MARRIFHLKTVISQSLGDSWSVEGMAAEVRMSASNLHQLFREKAGTTPMAWLHNLRLERAAEMLADSNCFLQIQEIAFQVGLKNSSHFTQDFKAKNGQTPTEYRRDQAEIHQSDSPDGQE